MLNGRIEEKKLTYEVVAENAITYEEIIKALEFKASHDAKVAYLDGCACKHIRVKDILGLIHSLQEEIADKSAEIERLTEESNEMFDRHSIENQAASLSIEKRNKENSELKKQVDEYKAKIEQGTLIELPCKVGDTCYLVYKGLGDMCRVAYKIKEVKIDNIHYIGNNEFFTEVGEYSSYTVKFGKEIFTTREEAEKRLKELQK